MTRLLRDLKWRWLSGRHFVGNFSTRLADSTISKELKQLLSQKVVEVADDFQWGSNSDILNSAMMFAYAYNITHKAKYWNAPAVFVLGFLEANADKLE